MARHPSRDKHIRTHLAYLAARLIAEDGIQDYATAKRKAARQAGMPDTRDLPDNQEIEAELRAYQALYQSDEQPKVLRRLREVAVKAMEFLADFNPRLTGSVLTGTANAHSDVNLQVFVDSPKDFEIFLLNCNVQYDSAARSYRLRERLASVPVYRLNLEGVEVSVAVFATDDQRVVQKYRADGRPIERAGLSEVKALLHAEPGATPRINL